MTSAFGVGVSPMAWRLSSSLVRQGGGKGEGKVSWGDGAQACVVQGLGGLGLGTPGFLRHDSLSVPRGRDGLSFPPCDLWLQCYKASPHGSVVLCDPADRDS